MCSHLEVEPVRRVVFFSQEDNQRCSICVVLSFLQLGLERRLSSSTVKVHAVAISAYHNHIDSKSVGKHDLVVRFLRGARWLNPP